MSSEYIELKAWAPGKKPLSPNGLGPVPEYTFILVVSDFPESSTDWYFRDFRGESHEIDEVVKAFDLEYLPRVRIGKALYDVEKFLYEDYSFKEERWRLIYVGEIGEGGG